MAYTIYNTDELDNTPLNFKAVFFVVDIMDSSLLHLRLCALFHRT